jgi:uncharacterized protein DUF7033
MIAIFLPSNNRPERRYSVEVLLGEILGVHAEITFHDENVTKIVLENGHQLIIEDHFFNSFQNEKSYLCEQALPLEVVWAGKPENPFIPEENLPVISGNGSLAISNEEIRCGVDVIGSAFYMLSRWEEYVVAAKDEHGRFPAEASLAARQGFLQRPVVNEYAEMIWNMLRYLGYSGNRKLHKFEAIITHDVDIPLLWPSIGFFLKKLTGDLVKRRNLKEVLFSIRSFFKTLLKITKDPYDTFDKLMSLSEQYGLKSHFFFLSEGKAALDASFPLDSAFIKNLMKQIQRRGHLIGIHPGYDTPTDDAAFAEQLTRLNNASAHSMRCGRQHFLRFEAPATWQIWEDHGLEWDSTLGFPEMAGFRCGTCTPFPVFNILTRKKLKLKEYPLTAMDVTWTGYQKYQPEEVMREVDSLLSKVRKYGGVFVLLWHNSSFHVPAWQEFEGVYEKILSGISILRQQS